MNKRVTQAILLLLAIYENAFFGGLIYGWTSLVYVLKNTGYYSDSCPAAPTDLTEAANGTNDTSEFVAANFTPTTDWADDVIRHQSCGAQDQLFNLAFTISAFTFSFSTFPCGIISDRLGLRVVKVTGWFFTAGGLLCFIFSSPSLPWLVFPAMVACAIGGCMLLMSNFQISHLFKKRKSTVMTIISGAFDAAALVFLIVKICYEYGIPIKAIFSVVAAGSILILVNSLLLLPKDNIPWPLPNSWWDERAGNKIQLGAKSFQKKLLNKKPKIKNFSEKNTIRKKSTFKVSLHGGSMGKLSLRQCLFSTLFISHLVWMSILQLRYWFFFGTFYNWLVSMADGNLNKVSQYTNALAGIQFASIIFAPMSGLILDRNKHKKGNEKRGQFADLEDSIMALAATTSASSIFSTIVLIPVLEIQIVGFIFQVILRTFLYSINAAFISLAFPSRYMGTLIGLAQAISGLFGLTEFLLFFIVQQYFDNDPFVVNIILLVLSILSYSHSIFTHLYIKRRKRNLEIDLEEEFNIQ